ncbi:hypothetical protein OB905_04885 [Halobacteria archaeon AArc-dxtr1]|nr:hypothetical protein [Halobacteria archaeon AArc-dxtr1]
MTPMADELAGVVDLFGGLTRPELERALRETAYRADGAAVDEDAVADAVDDALAAFALVECDPDVLADSADPIAADGGDRLLVAGPTAFPRVPEHAEDVPHILDVERRRLDREALADQFREAFADAVSAAVGEASPADDQPASHLSADGDRLRHLLDASYDAEAWAPVDLSAQRERLEAALDTE